MTRPGARRASKVEVRKWTFCPPSSKIQLPGPGHHIGVSMKGDSCEAAMHHVAILLCIQLICVFAHHLLCFMLSQLATSAASTNSFQVSSLEEGPGKAHEARGLHPAQAGAGRAIAIEQGQRRGASAVSLSPTRSIRQDYSVRPPVAEQSTAVLSLTRLSRFYRSRINREYLKLPTLSTHAASIHQSTCN